MAHLLQAYADSSFYSGHERLAEVQIHAGANINALDENMHTPLHLAAEKCL